MHVLFITRKWHGFGGMQRLSRDLWRAMQMMDGITPHLCRPYGSMDFSFPFRAMFWMRRARRKKWHVHLGDAALAWLAIIGKRDSKPPTLTACGLDVVYPGSMYQSVLRYALQFCGKVACISHATAVAIRQRGMPSAKIAVIPCGIWFACDSAPWRDPAQSNLVTVARLIPRKGVVWFLREVFPKLRRKFPELQYHIIGDGSDASVVNELCSVSPGVHWHGACLDEEKNKILAAATLLVMPNIERGDDMEGFGIVALEAAAAGVPVVAARLDGITDAVIDGETGTFFSPGNADDCLQKLVAALEDPMDSRKVYRAARAVFSWDLLLHRYRDELFT